MIEKIKIEFTLFVFDQIYVFKRSYENCAKFTACNKSCWVNVTLLYSIVVTLSASATIVTLSADFSLSANISERVLILSVNLQGKKIFIEKLLTVGEKIEHATVHKLYFNECENEKN